MPFASNATRSSKVGDNSAPTSLRTDKPDLDTRSVPRTAPAPSVTRPVLPKLYASRPGSDRAPPGEPGVVRSLVGAGKGGGTRKNATARILKRGSAKARWDADTGSINPHANADPLERLSGEARRQPDDPARDHGQWAWSRLWNGSQQETRAMACPQRTSPCHMILQCVESALQPGSCNMGVARQPQPPTLVGAQQGEWATVRPRHSVGRPRARCQRMARGARTEPPWPGERARLGPTIRVPLRRSTRFPRRGPSRSATVVRCPRRTRPISRLPRHP